MQCSGSKKKDEDSASWHLDPTVHWATGCLNVHWVKDKNSPVPDQIISAIQSFLECSSHQPGIRESTVQGSQVPQLSVASGVGNLTMHSAHCTVQVHSAQCIDSGEKLTLQLTTLHLFRLWRASYNVRGWTRQIFLLILPILVILLIVISIAALITAIIIMIIMIVMISHLSESCPAQDTAAMVTV